MKLTLIRDTFTSHSTTGRLLVDGSHEGFILEDIVRTGPKVHGQTAIPFGTYQVIINKSARFKRLLPLLVNVPGFAGIRIHPGNIAANTEGCLLPGTTRGKDFVSNSRVAFEKLFTKIKAAIAKGETVTIDIVDGRQPG